MLVGLGDLLHLDVGVLVDNGVRVAGLDEAAVVEPGHLVAHGADGAFVIITTISCCG